MGGWLAGHDQISDLLANDSMGGSHLWREVTSPTLQPGTCKARRHVAAGRCESRYLCDTTGKPQHPALTCLTCRTGLMVPPSSWTSIPWCADVMNGFDYGHLGPNPTSLNYGTPKTRKPIFGTAELQQQQQNTTTTTTNNNNNNNNNMATQSKEHASNQRRKRKTQSLGPQQTTQKEKAKT